MTEKTEDLIAEARGKQCGCSGQYCNGGLVRRLVDALEALLGERDAALAAIERVREIVTDPCSEGCCDICEGKNEGWEIVLQALDGAPEPEWEYQCTNSINTVEVWGDPEVHAKGCPGRIERRRKAGLWIPVEGESKP